MSATLRLELTEGASGGDVTIRTGGAVTLGRSPDCDVCLPDEGVSRRHARVECSGSAWLVADLDSRGGTRLGADRVVPGTPMPLRHGDTLRIGPYAFRVVIEGAAPDPYRTRATIFLRLRDDETAVRELSWEEFTNRYAPVIVGFARNRGLPAQDADDVLQEVMLAFFKVSPRFEYDPSRGRFRGYLKRVVRQVVAEHGRKARRAGVPAEDLDGQAAAEAEATWEEQWARRVYERALEELRRRLQPRTWEAFELFARRGVPAEEVSRRLDMPVNGVHSAKSRALRAIDEIVARIRREEG